MNTGRLKSYHPWKPVASITNVDLCVKTFRKIEEDKVSYWKGLFMGHTQKMWTLSLPICHCQELNYMAASNYRKNKEDSIAVCPVEKRNGIIDIWQSWPQFVLWLFFALKQKTLQLPHLTVALKVSSPTACPVFPHKVQPSFSFICGSYTALFESRGLQKMACGPASYFF